MTEIYDHYGDETLEQIQQQLNHLSGTSLYKELFAEGNIDPKNINSWEDFQELPFMTISNLLADLPCVIRS